ncbi:hypothetical protein [Longispora urticae]
MICHVEAFGEFTLPADDLRDPDQVLISALELFDNLVEPVSDLVGTLGGGVLGQTYLKVTLLDTPQRVNELSEQRGVHRPILPCDGANGENPAP